jgi:hypothetical protein
MIREMKEHMQMRKLPETVKFIIHPNQENVYEVLCKQFLSFVHLPSVYQIPMKMNE